MARTEQDYRNMLEADPTSMEAFSALRRTWQSEEKWPDLVWLYELRGNALDEDIRKADMFFKAADILFEKLQDEPEGMRLLYMGVLLDPRHRRNARKIREYLKEQNDQPRYLAILEKEIDFVSEQGTDRRGLAQLHHEAGMLFSAMEGFEEQALHHLKAAFEMDPQLTDALVMVADMYLRQKEFEKALPLLIGSLKIIRDPTERARKLELIAKIQLEKIRDTEAAEASLQEAIGLLPGDISILGQLTEVYLDRRYPQEKEPNRKVAHVFLQIARAHRAEQENVKAVTALKQAVAQDPNLREAFSLLASMYEADSNWEALAELFMTAMNQSEGQTRIRLGLRLAEVYEQNLNNADEALRIYETLSEESPDVVRPRLIALLERREDYDAMARLLEREVAAGAPGQTSEARLQLVRLYKERLGRADRAARHLHELLSSDPENLEVLDLYIQHFREKGDYRSQVETMETALKVAHSQGVDTSYVIDLLKEMASIYRSKLGDLARTERVLKFLVRLMPDNPKMQQSFEKIRQQREVWEGYKTEMQQEIGMTEDPYARLELMRGFAQTLLERKLDVDLCISLHQEIIQMSPGDVEAYEALEDLLTQEGNVENLFSLLEQRLVEATVEQQEEILRRMFDLARENLKDPSKIGRVAAKILEIVPDDPEALQALLNSLESLENWPKLTALLERWSTRLMDPEEQAPLLLKAADIYDRRLSKPDDALRCLGNVLANRMNMGTVIPRMLDLYERTGNYPDYANLLETGLREGDYPEDPSEVQPLWKRLAQILERQVEDAPRALEAWRQLWEMMPEDMEVLTNVTRLAYTLEQWELLVEIMESQIQRTSEPDKLNHLAMRLADIYDQKLDRPHDALGMLEKVEKSRRDRAVLEKMARLYQATGDVEGAIELFRSFMEEADTLEDKVNYSLKIAEIFLELAHDDASAADQLDHVLSLDPSNQRALVLQLDLCEREGRWERLAELTSQLYGVEADPDRKFVYARKLGELYDVHLENQEESFAWYRIAFQIRMSEPDILATLERIATENQYWENLVGVYDLLLREEWSSDRDILQKAVDCLRTKLSDFTRALDYVTRYLMRNQADEEFLYEAEDLSSQFPEGPKHLASLYEHMINNLSRGTRKYELLVKLARLYEEELNDQESALIRWERAFREDPVQEVVLNEIERLATATRNWDLLLVVQGIRLAHMHDPLEKVDFIIRCAQTAETLLEDPVRAFRAYLHAFLLEPMNNKIQEELWRLAKIIGLYSEDQRMAKPLEPDSLMAGGLRELKRRRSQKPAPVVTEGRRGENTQELEELDLEELEIVEEEEIPAPFVLASPTNSLQLADLIEVRTGSLQGVSYDDVLAEFQSDIDIQDVAVSSPGTTEMAPPESAWEEFARAWAMLPYATVEEHVEHLSQMARIWKDGAQNSRKSFEILGRAVTVNPSDPELREWFQFEGRALGVLGACGALLERIAGGMDDTAQAIGLYREASVLYQEIHQWQRMEDALRAILALDNHEMASYEALVVLLRQENQHENLVLLMEWKHQLDDLPLEEKIALIREIALVYENDLKRADQALAWWVRDLGMEPDNLEFLNAVLRLARQLQLWQKAAETLRKMADLADQEDEQLRLLHELAEITVSELELPDQAIHIFREILQIRSGDPVAVAALDKLYTTHELWGDLEEILEKQIQNADDGQRPAYMERLAEVLEKLDRPGEAAFIYEKLWQESARPVFARKASAMFMETGRAADGVEILQGLLNSENADYDASEKADLWTQLAIIQKRSLQNEAAARISLDRALETMPTHMGALQLIAEMAWDHKDWEKFVEVERRIADASKDPAERDAALFLAGRTLRDHVKDLVRARDMFGLLLKLNPQYVDALVAQSVLAEEMEDWVLALTMLEQRFPLLNQKEDRAKNLTRQAEIRLRHFQDTDNAYQILDEALAEDPNHVGAILALADLAEFRQEWDRAGELLENALKKLKDEPGKMSRLARRYAQLMERTGKMENAVTLLQEMERKYPDELLMKLTLGEIRYQQGRWRETTKLLGQLGEHPQATEFAADVANALCLAADAEVKQRKGMAPVELWETAVKLKPDHLPAIEALLAFHLERGDQAAAAGYLRAQAEAATNPDARFSLLNSLAELYMNEIKSPHDAYECYYDLWREISEPGPAHLDILKNLVRLAEELRRDHEVLAAYKLLVKLADDSEKLMLLVRTGEVALRMGEIETAQEVLETAQKKAPANEKVLSALAELYENTEQLPAALRILHELVERKVGAAAEPLRRSGVLKRLARVQMELAHEADGIITILEESVSLNPKDDDARRMLIQVYGDDPRFVEARSRQYQELLQKNPINSKALRDLADQAQNNGDTERRYLYTQLLALLGQTTEEESSWLAGLSGRYGRVSMDYANRLEDADKLEVESVAHATELVTVFETLWEAAPAVFGSDIHALGLDSGDKVSPVDKSDVATIYQELARVMGVRSTSLYLGNSENYPGVVVACHAPPVVIVGKDFLTEQPATLRFYIARAMELACPKFIFAAGLYPEDFSKLLAALTRAFHPKYSRHQFKTLDPVDERASELKKILPYRVSKTIVEFFGENPDLSFDSGAWRKAVWMAGNRMGLLMTGDLPEVLRLVMFEETQQMLPSSFQEGELTELCKKTPAIMDLLAFYVSPLHVRLRSQIGMTIDSNSPTP